MAKILPELMKSVSSLKKGRSRMDSVEATSFFFGEAHGFMAMILKPAL